MGLKKQHTVADFGFYQGWCVWSSTDGLRVEITCTISGHSETGYSAHQRFLLQKVLVPVVQCSQVTTRRAHLHYLNSFAASWSMSPFYSAVICHSQTSFCRAPLHWSKYVRFLFGFPHFFSWTIEKLFNWRVYSFMPISTSINIALEIHRRPSETTSSLQSYVFHSYFHGLW